MHEPTDTPDAQVIPASRRWFVAAGAILLAGCSPAKRVASAGLPGPWWSSSPELTPTPSPMPTLPLPGGTDAISRSSWAQGDPVPARMDRAQRITRITIHHDGMRPFTDTSASATAGRLESIRRAHLQRRPQRFGDIGYHYAVDPAGRLWACRPLEYQGAHVGGRNQGNLGIVVLGNFDKQSLNRAQQSAIISLLSLQASRYGIPASRIRTHMELAATACPGESLQNFMVAARRNGRIG